MGQESPFEKQPPSKHQQVSAGAAVQTATRQADSMRRLDTAIENADSDILNAATAWLHKAADAPVLFTHARHWGIKSAIHANPIQEDRFSELLSTAAVRQFLRNVGPEETSASIMDALEQGDGVSYDYSAARARAGHPTTMLVYGKVGHGHTGKERQELAEMGARTAKVLPGGMRASVKEAIDAASRRQAEGWLLLGLLDNVRVQKIGCQRFIGESGHFPDWVTILYKDSIQNGTFSWSMTADVIFATDALNLKALDAA